MKDNVLTWDEYFMGLANISAMRSKDPSTKVGACIIDDSRRVVSLGYNGFPNDCKDHDFPWNREGDYSETKYPFVVHAELNAILNSRIPLKGCTLYVSLFPCNECAKAIIQSGIRKIVYECDKYADTDSVKASKRMLEAANVEYEQLDFQIEVEFNKVFKGDSL